MTRRSTVLHDSKNATVSWLDDHRVVLKAFRDFIRADELCNAFDAGLDKLREEGGCKWLSDNRGLPTYTDEDITWINEDWFPRILEAGWKYWALVEPETVIGKWTMKNFAFYTERGIILQVFPDVESALAWLDAQT